MPNAFSAICNFARRLRRVVLFATCALALMWSCAPGFDPPSKVNGLRILAVAADKPYALAGEQVTLRMTVSDGLRDRDGKPRSLQILWIAGCIDPQGDQYFLCFEQLAQVLGPLLQSGTLPPSDVVRLTTATAEQDGEAGAHSFTFTVPADIVTRRPPPAASPHYGIAYIFFAACAGTLAPAPLELLGSTVPELPLRCLGSDGNPQGPDSFVPGYTQIYSFADGRPNKNPATDALTLDGQPLPSDASSAIVVPVCSLAEQERRARGCAKTAVADVCRQHDIRAVVADVAETIEGADESGGRLREVIWVSYFADGGDIETSIRLVSDARLGYQDAHGTTWTAPDKPRLVSIWAVVRDQRGGESVRRGFVRVQ